MPTRRFSTPTEVSSPRSPDRGKPASCRKSKPISARTSPAGTVCTSVVLKGPSCAEAAPHAKQNRAKTKTTLRMPCKVAQPLLAVHGVISAEHNPTNTIHNASLQPPSTQTPPPLAKRIIQSSQRRDHRRFRAENQTPQRRLAKSRRRRCGKFLLRPSSFGANR